MIGVLWALGVVAEIVLFAFAGRLPPAIGPVDADHDRRHRGGRALEHLGARSARCCPIPLQLMHGAILRRDLSRHHDIPQPQRARQGGRAAAQGDIATATA